MPVESATATPTRQDEVLAAINELFDPANRADPYSPTRTLRELGPIHPTSLGPCLITRFDDCFSALGDTAWSHAGEDGMLHAHEDSEEAAQERGLMAKTLAWMDPPDHTRLRGLVIKAFTAKVVAKMRSRIEEISGGLVDQARSEGEFDVVERLAYPLPLTVISELIGIPASDHSLMREWSQHMARAFDPDSQVSLAERVARRTASRELFYYFRNLLDKRHENPGKDLLSALAAVEEVGDVLSETEILATCVTMLVAGHETTVNLIGNGLLALMRNPEQYELLRKRPELIKSAVDELMRFDPSVQMSTRTANQPTVLAGHEFNPGDGVILLINSGNRDPARFSDPDRLDISRYHEVRTPRPRHLSFGWGIHYCLGASLAVMQMEILLQHLVHRVPMLELGGAGPTYRPNLFFRGLSSLPVRLCR